MTKRICLVVFSGGQDSTTCLALAMREKQKGVFDEVHAITFDYGQRHNRELDAAYVIARLAGVDSHEVCEVGPILKGTSPLTDSSQELEQYTDHDTMAAIIGDRVEKTFVPMRNALFLTLAANRAAVLGAQCITTGVCEADNANYPDCRRVFIDSQEEAINEALGTSMGDAGYIRIWTPLMTWSKKRTVRELSVLGSEWYSWLAFSHTAYDGQYPPMGNDHATLLRAQGFAEAGLPDPLLLRAVLEGYDVKAKTGGAEYAGVYTNPMSGFTGAIFDAIETHKKTIMSWVGSQADLIDPSTQAR